MSTDLYGMAALDACEQITERLKPVIAGLPDDSPFSAVVTVSLVVADAFAVLSACKSGDFRAGLGFRQSSAELVLDVENHM